MKERLASLGRLIFGLLRAVVRGVWAVVCALVRQVAKAWSLLALGSQIRARQRERRAAFEQVGRMVYLLYKRSLVRNHDLLLECEKVQALDVELDLLRERADAVRVARPVDAEPAPAVLPMPVETDAAADLAPRATTA